MEIPAYTIVAMSEFEPQDEQRKEWEKQFDTEQTPRVTLHDIWSHFVGCGLSEGWSALVDLTHYPRPLSCNLCVILGKNGSGNPVPVVKIYERPTTDGYHIVYSIDEDGKTKYARRKVTKIYGVVTQVRNAVNECVWSESDELESFPTEPPTFALFYADSKWEEQMVSETLGTPKEAKCLSHNLYDKYIAVDIAAEAESTFKQVGYITAWTCSERTLAAIWNAGRIQGIREERYKRRQKRERSAAPCEE